MTGRVLPRSSRALTLTRGSPAPPTDLIASPQVRRFQPYAHPQGQHALCDVVAEQRTVECGLGIVARPPVLSVPWCTISVGGRQALHDVRGSRMARKAFLHINGVTYELAFEVDSEYDQAFHDVERRIGELTSGSGNQQTFSVLIDGQPAELRARQRRASSRRLRSWARSPAP